MQASQKLSRHQFNKCGKLSLDSKNKLQYVTIRKHFLFLIIIDSEISEARPSEEEP